MEPRGRKSGPHKAPTNHPEAARLHTYTSQHILQHALKGGALIQGSFTTTTPMAMGVKEIPAEAVLIGTASPLSHITPDGHAHSGADQTPPELHTHALPLAIHTSNP